MIFSSDKAVCAGAPAALKLAEPATQAAIEITQKKCFIDPCLIELFFKAAGFLAGAAGLWLGKKRSNLPTAQDPEVDPDWEADPDWQAVPAQAAEPVGC